MELHPTMVAAAPACPPFRRNPLPNRRKSAPCSKGLLQTSDAVTVVDRSKWTVKRFARIFSIIARRSMKLQLGDLLIFIILRDDSLALQKYVELKIKRCLIPMESPNLSNRYPILVACLLLYIHHSYFSFRDCLLSKIQDFEAKKSRILAKTHAVETRACFHATRACFDIFLKTHMGKHAPRG